MRWALLLFAAGCVEQKVDTGALPVPPWETDDDGDGFTADLDCDDADAGVNPGAPERCDGLDQDCDDLVDEDAVDALAWYADDDGDGHGDPYAIERACDPIPGRLAEDGDCDDADAEIFPGAPERCNGQDDDCDDEVDEGELPDAPTWYADADGDTYGDAAAPLVSCPQPDGYVADATDCDDAVATVSPAGTETCDGVDQDCDGAIDDDPVDGELWYADADGDTWGDPVSAGYFCPSTHPAGTVRRGDDCDDTNAAVSPDGVELCDGVDEDCDGSVDEGARDATTWYLDVDGDGYGDDRFDTDRCEAPAGYVATPGDCEDTDADVSPEGVEYCDGVDTNCNGMADDGAVDASTWYADADSDGYGAAGTSSPSCDAPPGYVADATDCDDTYAATFPGADEYCDGIDTDCDGTVDEDDALDAPTWYADVDADGYGDAADPYDACAVPAGYAAPATDCDDGDATASPGLPETCDGRDDDCDGTVDEDDAVDATTWFFDADADGYGDPDAPYAACAAPAGYVAADTDCDDTNELAAPGRPEVCDDGADNDCDGTGNGCVRTGELELADLYHARVLGTSHADEVGASADFAGDVDGDGIADLVVGVPGVGEAWLYAGVPYGDLDVNDTSAALIGSWGADTGRAVAGLGDFDGDGVDDVAVGSPGSSGGSVAVLFGTWNTNLVVANADLTLQSEGPDDHLGWTLAAAGDLDGDGLSDLVVGAHEADTGSVADAGAAYVIYGGADGIRDAGLADGAIYGATASSRMGYAVAGVGDVDGDGLDDLLVGAPSDRTGALLAGAAYLVLGPASGTYTPSTADAAFLGATAASFAGTSVAAAGDTDGDGQLELLVGGTHADGGGTDSGAAWLFRGPFAGTTSVSAAAATLDGGDAGERAGFAVAGLGDFDQDGADDLAIGAPYDDDAATNAGTTYLLYGPGAWSADLGLADVLLTGSSESYAGSTVVGDPLGGGDLTGDGVPDLLVGAPDDDTVGASAGALYVVPGRGI